LAGEFKIEVYVSGFTNLQFYCFGLCSIEAGDIHHHVVQAGGQIVEAIQAVRTCGRRPADSRLIIRRRDGNIRYRPSFWINYAPRNRPALAVRHVGETEHQQATEKYAYTPRPHFEDSIHCISSLVCKETCSALET